MLLLLLISESVLKFPWHIQAILDPLLPEVLL